MTVLAISPDERHLLIETSEGRGYIEDKQSGTQTEEKSIIALLSANIDWQDPAPIKLIRKQGPPGPPPRPGLTWKPETHRWIKPDGGEEHHDWEVTPDKTISGLSAPELEAQIKDRTAFIQAMGYSSTGMWGSIVSAMEERLDRLKTGTGETTTEEPKPEPEPEAKVLDFGTNFQSATAWQEKQKPKLSYKHQAVVNFYVNAGYEDINHFLRNDVDPFSVEDEDDYATSDEFEDDDRPRIESGTSIKTVVSLIEQAGREWSFPQDMLVHRGAHMDIAAFSEGSWFVDRGMTSTALDTGSLNQYASVEGVGGAGGGESPVHMKITVPKGMRGVHGEKGEVILMPGTRFKVGKIEQEGGRHVVHLTAVR